MSRTGGSIKPTHKDFCPWPLLTKEQLAKSPSQRGGYTAAEERKWRNKATTMIRAAGERLKLEMPVIAVGQMFCVRYFALKSFQKNDYRIIAMACLFLAAKSENHPRALNDVVHQSWIALAEKVKKAKQKEAHIQKLKERFTDLREAVLLGERSLLYTLGFQFTGLPVYSIIWTFLAKLERHEDPVVAKFFSKSGENAKLLQGCWSLANDMYERTQLCLMYDTVHLAIAIMRLPFKMSAIGLATENQVPLVNGQPYFVWANEKANTKVRLDMGAVQQIMDAMQSLYVAQRTTAQDGEGSPQGPPGPPTPAGEDTPGSSSQIVPPTAHAGQASSAAASIATPANGNGWPSRGTPGPASGLDPSSSHPKSTGAPPAPPAQAEEFRIGSGAGATASRADGEPIDPPPPPLPSFSPSEEFSPSPRQGQPTDESAQTTLAVPQLAEGPPKLDTALIRARLEERKRQRLQAAESAEGSPAGPGKAPQKLDPAVMRSRLERAKALGKRKAEDELEAPMPKRTSPEGASELGYHFEP